MKVYVITFVGRITIYLWGESFSDEVRIVRNEITILEGENAWSYIFGFFFFLFQMKMWLRCNRVLLIELLSKEIPLKFDYIIRAHDKNFLFCVADYSRVGILARKFCKKVSRVWIPIYFKCYKNVFASKKKIEQHV